MIARHTPDRIVKPALQTALLLVVGIDRRVQSRLGQRESRAATVVHLVQDAVCLMNENCRGLFPVALCLYPFIPVELEVPEVNEYEGCVPPSAVAVPFIR